ncbi:MFS transporter [Arsenicicoccus sp. oral taxon 190]|uniref:MFS transporter n=1 Tax=Arsenicicoccus sp. oral taxon 190 TaxID=1658671 RepID=UPI00067A0A92|nr:MFS transporter [Arsenicicoccus sp. oral taxon 190]AKT51595.1 glucarate transporter [Arsenicicoccus sp. oral taxon 190]
MSTAARTAADPMTQRPTRKRYLIMVMLFVTVVINYLDRSNLSVAAPGIAKDLHLTTFQQGLILSAFGWTYAAAQIPGGWLVDRVPPRILYPAALILWSLATCLMGVVGSFVGLIVLRLAVGAFEAPAYPINNKVVTAWFPERERAGAIGFYTSGQFVGLAMLTPVLLWLQTTFGWHMIFVVTGLVGIVWGVVWFVVYRGPRDFRGTNQAELDHIAAGGGLIEVDQEGKAKEPFRWSDLGVVLTKRKLWGVYLGQFCLTSTLWFFLTWFPTYLVKYRGMDFIKSGFLASLPFLAAFVGVLFSGVLSDWMIRRGASLGTARKVPIITGLLISIAMIGANYTDSTTLVIVFLAIAFFGNGLASITWSLVSALAPARLLGLTGGVFNFIGNLSSIATPLIIGALVTETDFTPALVYVAVLSALGALSYLLLVGRVERIEC